MEINKRITKLINDNYNLSAILKDFCNNEKNLYNEECSKLSTLSNIMFDISDEINSYIINEGSEI